MIKNRQCKVKQAGEGGFTEDVPPLHALLVTEKATVASNREPCNTANMLQNMLSVTGIWFPPLGTCTITAAVKLSALMTSLISAHLGLSLCEVARRKSAWTWRRWRNWKEIKFVTVCPKVTEMAGGGGGGGIIKWRAVNLLDHCSERGWHFKHSTFVSSLKLYVCRVSPPPSPQQLLY